MITHVGSTSVTTTGGTLTATVTAPTGISADDCIFLAITIAGTRTFTWPSGFTQIQYANVSGTTSSVAYKIAAGTESGSSLAVTISGVAGPKITLLSSVYSGTHPTSPIDGSGQGASTSSSTTYATPTVVTTASGCAEVSFIGKTRGNSTPQISVFTEPAPLTKAIEAFSTEAAGSSAMAIGYNLTGVGSGASIGNRTWTTDQASQSAAITVSLQPADGGGGGGGTDVVTYRDSASAVNTGASTTISVTAPASILVGDLIILTIAAASTRTYTWPSGFIEQEYVSIAGTSFATAYKIADGGEAGTSLSVTISGVAGPKLALGCSVYYGVDQADPVPVSNATISSSQSSTYTTPTVTTTAAQCAEVSMVAIVRGNTTPQITAFTAPSPLTKAYEAFTTASAGSSAMALGHNLSGVIQGTVIGNRNWSADQAGQGAGITLAIKPASAADPVSVEVDSSVQTVEPFSTVTLHATASGGDNPTVSWAQLSGTSVTLGGSGATRTFTAPALIDGDTLEFEATADDGTTSDTATCTVTVYPVNEFVRDSGTWVPVEITVK